MTVNRCLLLILSAVRGLPSPSESLVFVNEPRSWEDARSYCRKKYSDLATPESVEEMSRLQQSVEPKYRGDVWIGLKGAAQQPWLWSGNANLQYTHWRSGQPTDRDLCVQAWDERGWFVLDPSPWWFLCYVENSSPKYVMIRETKTWIAAQSYCREHYVDLASIESQEDEELVWKVSEGHPVWIGLFKDSWEWVGQRRSSSRYWAAETEMSGTGEDCAAVRTSEGGRWYRHLCSVTNPFVCQYSEKRQFVRLVLEAKDGVDLNDPNVNKALLEQIKAKLKEQGLSDDAHLQWRENEDGIFKKVERKMRVADEL
ncbi:putative C-type lectin domain family 20 member A [Alosa pseudoharengus]|uniref:putative C-type lectin domain family 20 member A n=1 Tax=Alosa pseudoharengus TaxID=34774 RepID=UPI003F8BBFDA